MRSFKRVAVIVGLTALSSMAFAEQWQVVKDEQGIQVSLSDVAGSKYKAYRGVTLIKAPLATITRLQEDVAGSCAWIHECKQQKLLKHEGDQTWTYAQFNTPWPVTARDSVLHITTEQGADGSVTRKIEAAPTYQPEEKGFVRVAAATGFWKLVSKGDATEVTYQLHTDPGGSVPSWLSNKFVVEAPFNTLKALKERAEAAK